MSVQCSRDREGGSGERIQAEESWVFFVVLVLKRGRRDTYVHSWGWVTHTFHGLSMVGGWFVLISW